MTALAEKCHLRINLHVNSSEIYRENTYTTTHVTSFLLYLHGYFARVRYMRSIVISVTVCVCLSVCLSVRSHI